MFPPMVETGFNLLLAKFDADRETAGEKYLALLDELTNYLRLKNCADAQGAAEEALDRTARKIAGGEDVQNLRAYAFRVAKFVLLEKLRQPQTDELPADFETKYHAPEPEQTDARLDCLEACLKTLEDLDREIITNYYHGEGKEKAALKAKLAERLNLTATALKLRALRTRQKLEKCINKCVNR